MSGSTKRPKQAATDEGPPDSAASTPPEERSGDLARLQEAAARMSIDKPIDLRARAAESGSGRLRPAGASTSTASLSSAGLSADNLAGPHASSNEWTRLVDSLIGDVLLGHVCGARVLDLGHGSPEIAGWVRERAGDQLTVVEKGALEQIPMKIAEESGFLPAGEFLDADGKLRLPEDEEEDGQPVLRLREHRDASVDVVYCLRTFPHLGYDTETSERLSRQLLREAARVTADGGTVFVQIANPRSLRGIVEGIRNPITVVSRRRMILGDRYGLTRWDTLPRFMRFLPPELEFVRAHGLGVVIPHNAALQIPLVGWALSKLEWRLRDMGIIRRFGAQLLVELRRLHRADPSLRAGGPQRSSLTSSLAALGSSPGTRT
ncbi:class I SAM-dependent methyltransferase [Pseudenhygromyxa sp. WMMC2535]|uniref:class I SAM-dependent methyltransferase n=1 Tax=Pseudenhygromyxa sp. WMMC2535 TaxID=2712867 RepID=UPI001552966C|nr:class I SAM-dependent methyltransferase [Pseudenhygromyxa sp. WMMC2535]NVB42250.1 class I SAM-dependent methyltransferase [Pseudenhygromyxa sp. WMMC2535]